MKKTLTYAHTWENIPGSVIVEVADIASAYSSNQKNLAAKPQATTLTLGSWRHRFGNQVPLTTPFSGQQVVLFDISPWSHLSDDTCMRVEMSFVPGTPIPPTDPRHPKNMRP